MAPHPKSGRLLFEVLSGDGRPVACYDDYFEHHVIGKHPEVSKVPDYLEKIQDAIRNFTTIRYVGNSTNPTYVGARLQFGFHKDYCYHVSVGFRDRVGVVLTVQLKLAD